MQNIDVDIDIVQRTRAKLSIPLWSHFLHGKVKILKAIVALRAFLKIVTQIFEREVQSCSCPIEISQTWLIKGKRRKSNTQLRF